MKARTEKLKAVVMTSKWGVVEGVIVTPEAAQKILAYATNIELGMAPMRTLCKSVMSK